MEEGKFREKEMKVPSGRMNPFVVGRCRKKDLCGRGDPSRECAVGSRRGCREVSGRVRVRVPDGRRRKGRLNEEEEDDDEGELVVEERGKGEGKGEVNEDEVKGTVGEH